MDWLQWTGAEAIVLRAWTTAQDQATLLEKHRGRWWRFQDRVKKPLWTFGPQWILRGEEWRDPAGRQKQGPRQSPSWTILAISRDAGHASEGPRHS